MEDSGKRCQQNTENLQSCCKEILYVDKKSLSRAEIEDVLLKAIQKVYNAIERLFEKLFC